LIGLAIGCVVLAASAAGCAPPLTGAAGEAPLLYVANGLDDTISRIDSRNGRAVGPAVPGGAAPRQIVVGPNGSLLVLSAAVEGRRPLTLTSVTRHGSVWTARPIVLERGARRALVAGDGGRYALVAYHAPDPARQDEAFRCRLAVVDLATGHIGDARTVCAGRDEVVGLALEGGSPGDGSDGGSASGTAYLAVWRRPAAEDGCPGSSGSRIVALHAGTGAAVAVSAVDGVPGGLVLANAPGRLGRRLYVLEATGAAGLWLPDECQYMTHDKRLAAAEHWTALGLSPTNLEVESRQDMGQTILHGFAVAPDGDGAFALGTQGMVVSLDLRSGRINHLVSSPDIALGLAITADRIYVTNSFGADVWVLDRRDGHRLQTITTGRRPIGVTMGNTRPR
jgi:DNA-binding beta-propeller fold protein YncE